MAAPTERVRTRRGRNAGTAMRNVAAHSNIPRHGLRKGGPTPDMAAKRTPCSNPWQRDLRAGSRYGARRRRRRRRQRLHALHFDIGSHAEDVPGGQEWAQFMEVIILSPPPWPGRGDRRGQDGGVRGPKKRRVQGGTGRARRGHGVGRCARRRGQDHGVGGNAELGQREKG